MADPLIAPEFRQAPSQAGWLNVPVPNDPYNRTVDFPQDTPPETIRRVLDELRASPTESFTDPRAGVMGQLATAAPEMLSTGAAIATGLSPFKSPAAVGAAAGAGQAVGRGLQRAYDIQHPATTVIPYKTGGVELPVSPLPGPPASQVAGESGLAGVMSGLAEKVLPKVGPLLAGMGRAVSGITGRQTPKQWLAEKLLYPERGVPETQEMMEVQKMIHGAGGPDLPISRLAGQDVGVVPKTMEAIAYGGASRGIHKSLSEAQKALQRKGEEMKASWGLPQANDIGKRLAGMMDTSYDYNVKRVQDQAYDTIRMRLPQGQAFINAEATLGQITAPNSRLGSHIISELQTVVDAKPAAASLLNKLRMAGQQATAAAKGEPIQPALNHWLTFDEAVELRTSLYKLGKLEYGLPTEDRLAAQAAQTLGRQLSGTIRQGLATINPKLAGIQARADKIISGIKDTFKNDDMEKFRVALEADPVTALKELMKPDNAAKIQKIRAYLEPHKARLGQSTFTSTWDDIQRWFSGELIQEATQNVVRPGGKMGGVIEGNKLAAAVNTYNRDTVNAIWGDKGEAFHQLRLLARGLEGTAEQPTGMGKIAIQLAIPGAAIGVGAGAYSLAAEDDPYRAAKSVGAGAVILLTPQALGAILLNKSMLKNFTTGVWEYRKYGAMPDGLRLVIRQGEALAARMAAEKYGMPFYGESAKVQALSQGQLPQPPTDLPFQQALPQIGQAPAQP